tara:strand:+ start:409 stop:609 length:201 start_codon:yes stop_codon:yes gene_type:complete
MCAIVLSTQIKRGKKMQKREQTKRLTVQFPLTLYKQVKKQAIDEQVSLSQYFIRVLHRQIKYPRES